MAKESAKNRLEQQARGTYVGTGAAQSIKLGFKAHIIMVFNETDGNQLWFHIRGQADASAIQIDTAVSFITSNGITDVEGGFNVGTALSTNAKTYRYYVIL